VLCVCVFSAAPGQRKMRRAVYCDIKASGALREDLRLLKNNNENMRAGARGRMYRNWRDKSQVGNSDRAIGAHGRLRLPAGA
jgi:hypothetical protein